LAEVSGGKGVGDRSRDIPRTLLPGALGSLILFLIRALLLALCRWRPFPGRRHALLIYCLGAASCAADDYHVWRLAAAVIIVYKPRRQTFNGWCRAKSRNSRSIKKTRRPREQKFAILGGGSWAPRWQSCFRARGRKHEISLWVHDRALADSIRRDAKTAAILRDIG